MRTIFFWFPHRRLINAQAYNRGLETSISGVFLRIIVYAYLYDSIYCLANSFLTKTWFL